MFRSLRTCNKEVHQLYTISSRPEFQLPANVERKRWFPTHMSVQMAKMEGRLRTVDLIVEVHDSRIPFTGRNPEFQSKLYAIRPHILVLNKRDLIDRDKYRSHGITHVLWTDCKKKGKKALRDLKDLMLDMLRSDYRFNRTVKTEYQVMVVGIPNAGKSSLINGLRTATLDKQKKAVKEGGRPGVTVRMQNRVKVLDRPPIYILDTPGVLNPYVRSLEESMKLALCENILETTLNLDHVADYLLYWYNKHEDYSYLRALELEGAPTDDIQQLLTRICQQRDLVLNKLVPGKGHFNRWNFWLAREMFLNTFRKNQVDDCFLDKDKI